MYQKTYRTRGKRNHNPLSKLDEELKNLFELELTIEECGKALSQ